MTLESSKKRVHAERLRHLGFSEDLIADAVEYEATGLLEIEPSAGLLQRTVAACTELFPEKEPVPQPDPWKAVIAILFQELIRSVEISKTRPLLDALRAALSIRWEGKALKCIYGLPFALREGKRPLMILENHNLIEPGWFAVDKDFHSLSTACTRINIVARSAGVDPCARVVVLRPEVSGYSPADVDAIHKLLREASSDVWWLPVREAAGFANRDVVVIGEKEILDLEYKASSPQEAIEAMNEVDDPQLATIMRFEIEQVLAKAQPIKQRGHLMIKNFGVTKGGSEGVKELLGKVIGGTASQRRKPFSSDRL